MPFSFSLLSKNDGIAHLAAEGAATAVDFRPAGPHHFDNLLGGDWPSKRVLVNMERVPCIDSSAIGWLIHAQRAFRAAGGQLVLHSLSPAVKNVLELLKFSRLVPLAPSEHEARQLLDQQPVAN
ncbi:MAG: STAS domain-containing protein [Phycisphaerae bacterium]